MSEMHWLCCLSYFLYPFAVHLLLRNPLAATLSGILEKLPKIRSAFERLISVGRNAGFGALHNALCSMLHADD